MRWHGLQKSPRTRSTKKEAVPRFLSSSRELSLPATDRSARFACFRMRRGPKGSVGTMYQFSTANLRTNKHNKAPIIDDADIAAGEAAAAEALLKSSQASLSSCAAASPNPSRSATPHTTPSRPVVHKHHSHASDRSGNSSSTVQFSAPNSSDYATINGTAGNNHPSLYLSTAPTSMNSLAKATSDLEFFEDLVSEPVLVLGMDISHLSRQWQFVVCATGVFWFSLLYGYLQELISVQLCSRKLGLFLAAAQFTGYTGTSMCGCVCLQVLPTARVCEISVHKSPFCEPHPVPSPPSPGIRFATICVRQGTTNQSDAPPQWQGFLHVVHEWWYEQQR